LGEFAGPISRHLFGIDAMAPGAVLKAPPEHLQQPSAAVALTHGSVVITAITSCTNTSNPSVLALFALMAALAIVATSELDEVQAAHVGTG